MPCCRPYTRDCQKNQSVRGGVDGALQHDRLGPVAGQLAAIALGEPSALPEGQGDLIAGNDRQAQPGCAPGASQRTGVQIERLTATGPLSGLTHQQQPQIGGGGFGIAAQQIEHGGKLPRLPAPDHLFGRERQRRRTGRERLLCCLGAERRVTYRCLIGWSQFEQPLQGGRIACLQLTQFSWHRQSCPADRGTRRAP